MSIFGDGQDILSDPSPLHDTYGNNTKVNTAQLTRDHESPPHRQPFGELEDEEEQAESDNDHPTPGLVSNNSVVEIELDASSKRQKLPNYRHWTTNELNLVNAFEDALTGDLSHNLFGIALEKRARLLRQSDHQSKPRSRKRLRSQTIHQSASEFTSWPLSLDRVPRPRDLVARSDEDNTFRIVAKAPVIDNARGELLDELSTRALGIVREHTQQDHEDDALSSSRRQLEPEDNVSFLLDEDLALEIVHPSMRSVLAKADELLATLRAARARQQSSRPSESRQRRHSTGLAGSYSRARSRSRSVTMLTLNDANEKGDHVDLHNSAMEDPFSARQGNWEDVVDLASSSGFSQKVVERVRARCVEMFGVNSAASNTASENSILERSGLRPEASLPDLSNWFLLRLYCPHDDCLKYQRKFKQQVKLLHHIRKHHGWDPICQLPQQFVSPPDVGDWSLKDLRCPAEHCMESEQVFPDMKVLREHVLARHLWDPAALPLLSKASSHHSDRRVESGRPYRLSVRENLNQMGLNETTTGDSFLSLIPPFAA